MPYGNGPAVEALAERFKETSLIEQKSLITGETIWTYEYFDELYRAYNLNLHVGKGGFEDKVRSQLKGISSTARQLFAEIYILNMLPLGNIGHAKKIQNLERVLKECDPPVAIPADISETLEAGAFNGGLGYNNYRWGHFVYFIEFGRAFSALPLEERRQKLSTADAIEDTIYNLVDSEAKGRQSFQKALCYLFAPDDFEPIISLNHLTKIVRHFESYVAESEKGLSLQRKAAAIRHRLAVERENPDWHFYLDDDEWKNSSPKPTAQNSQPAKNPADTDSSAESDMTLTLSFADGAASKLMVTEAWLDRFLTALNRRRQLILQGPPGTGKTYLARRMARLLSGSEDRVKLVQFHPAYTYEDFFEGYRPVASAESGVAQLQLREGPLRVLAQEASENPDQPYFLIIDEINRGNLARIFGELYFLLEYREHDVELMYSQDRFSLPQNLFIIGTMNTADRSIALVDAAMRRRFAFLDLHPDEEPVLGLLDRWAQHNGLQGLPVDAWKAVNRKISQHEFKVGPSYFMRPEIFEPGGLEELWESEIIPLLDEYFYGSRDMVRSEYSLGALLGPRYESTGGYADQDL